MSARLARHVALCALLAALHLSGGCASPLAEARSFARAHGFQETTVTGVGFHHVVWRKPGPPSDPVLHVYLEGDGTPHPSPIIVARDPTPHDPLMLHLMALDPHPSIYVGRPCYWGLSTDGDCSAALWTLARFSAPVVDSMVAVIVKESGVGEPNRRVLYGHSGGATLALLTVSRGLQVAGIVTVGGNLDPGAWTALHHYTPLSGLNPVVSGIPPPRPPMRHYVGDQDATVPVSLIRAAAQQVGGEVIVVPGYDHHCCWEKIWAQAVEFPDR